MSSALLQEAIIDAKALKEAAMRQAKDALINEHADVIKDAVEKMLEAEDEEDPFGGGGEEEMDMGMDDEMGGDGIDIAIGGEDEIGGGVDSGIAGDVPLAATDGEPLCPCADEEEEIEISFDELEKQMAQDPGGEDDMLDREEVADELPMGGEEEDEEIELEEDDLSALLEELVVDNEPLSATGNMGTNPAEQRDQVEAALATMQDTAVEEEVEELKKALDETKKLAETRKNKNKKLIAERDSLKNTLLTIKGKIEEINLTNARLFYTNRALASTSLNERQKKELADALQKADSVLKAKVIYETLQSSTAGNRKPARESLREVASKNRPSLAVQPRPKVDEAREKKADPVMDRMQKLAGIKKSKN